MNPDDLLPTVTAIVKYDLYPHYLVRKGKLRPDGGIQMERSSYYSPDCVIKVFPESEYEAQEARQRKIVRIYREKTHKLRIDILNEADVDFITVK